MEVKNIYQSPKSWNDKKLDWDNIDPLSVDFYAAIINAVNERFTIFHNNYSYFYLDYMKSVRILSPYTPITINFFKAIKRAIDVMFPVFHAPNSTNIPTVSLKIDDILNDDEKSYYYRLPVKGTLINSDNIKKILKAYKKVLDAMTFISLDAHSGSYYSSNLQYYFNNLDVKRYSSRYDNDNNLSWGYGISRKTPAMYKFSNHCFTKLSGGKLVDSKNTEYAVFYLRKPKANIHPKIIAYITAKKSERYNHDDDYTYIFDSVGTDYIEGLNIRSFGLWDNKKEIKIGSSVPVSSSGIKWGEKGMTCEYKIFLDFNNDQGFKFRADT